MIDKWILLEILKVDSSVLLKGLVTIRMAQWQIHMFTDELSKKATVLN